MERIRDIMTPEPLVARTDTPIGQCAGWMLRHRIRHLPVVDSNGVAVAVVTDDAVFRYGGLGGADFELWVPFEVAGATLHAGDLAVPIEVSANVDELAPTTLKRILESDQDFAVITNEHERVVGIVTEHDGVRMAAAVLEDRALSVRIEGSSPVATAGLVEPAINALDHMRGSGIRHLAVVDGDGVLTGVISRGDLLSENLRPLDPRTIGQVMRKHEIQTTSAGARLAEAAYRMLTEHIGCLPVVNARGKPVEIITRSDLIEAALVAVQEEAVFPMATG